MKRKERAGEQNLKNLDDVLTDKRITIIYCDELQQGH